jgi:signal peptidase I
LNFALFLFVLLLVTGGVWLLEKYVLGKKRPKEAKQPWWVEYSVSFFPVILIVFLLRSFLIEPFKIPSGSMLPTLLVGDFILVNKFTYGIRIPIINAKVIDVNLPLRGEVMVFRYPENPSLDYIKRVVGVPGDQLPFTDLHVGVFDGVGFGVDLPAARALVGVRDDRRLLTLHVAHRGLKPLRHVYEGEGAPDPGGEHQAVQEAGRGFGAGPVLDPVGGVPGGVGGETVVLLDLDHGPGGGRVGFGPAGV